MTIAIINTTSLTEGRNISIDLWRLLINYKNTVKLFAIAEEREIKIEQVEDIILILATHGK